MPSNSWESNRKRVANLFKKNGIPQAKTEEQRRRSRAIYWAFQVRDKEYKKEE